VQGHDRAPIDPTVMPTDTQKFPRATRILTRRALLAAWKGSRDATQKPGARGVDEVSARQFKETVDQNILRISAAVRGGGYRFSRLRPFFVEKKNGKLRVICVPTVADRLVQRATVQYISANDRLRLLNEVSYGFVSGAERGVRGALSSAMRLRAKHEWVLKTDIQSFFDEIDRSILKKTLKKRLGKHGLVPLLCAAIDTEIRIASASEAEILRSQGIRHGRGLRQGMPLSPLLSNFALSGFDAAVMKGGWKLIRYADDLMLFGDTKSEVQDGFDFLVNELGKINHSLPKPGPDSKTEYVAPKMPVEFLGLEIVHTENAGRYVCRMPRSAKEKALSNVKKIASVESALKDKLTLAAIVKRLEGLPASYRSAFSLAEDWSTFEPQIGEACSRAYTEMFSSIFGRTTVASLSAEHQHFLGFTNISFD